MACGGGREMVVLLWISCVLSVFQPTGGILQCPEGTKDFMMNYRLFNDSMEVYVKPQEVGPNNIVIHPEEGCLGSGDYVTMKGKQKYFMNDIDQKQNRKFYLTRFRFQVKKCKKITLEFFQTKKSRRPISDNSSQKWFPKSKRKWTLYDYAPAANETVLSGMVGLKFLATRAGSKIQKNQWEVKDLFACGCMDISGTADDQDV